jgi:hypothetical protein
VSEALQVEVREPEGHAETFGQRPLGQRHAFADRRQDVQIAGVVALRAYSHGWPFNN